MFKNIHLEEEILPNYDLVLKNAPLTPEMAEQYYEIDDDLLAWSKDMNGVVLEVTKSEEFRGHPLYYAVGFLLNSPALKKYNTYLKNWVKEKIIDPMNEDTNEEKVKIPKGKTELWRTAISGRYVSDNAGFAIFKSSEVTTLQMLNDYKIVMAEKSHLLIYGTGSYEYFCKLCANISKFLRSLPDIS